MARTIKVKSRSALPGVGFDSAGNPKQGKRRLVGGLAVTSYTSVGESLTATDLGLVNIDFIQINHADQAAAQGGSETRLVNYCNTTSDFYIVEWSNTTGSKPASGATHTLSFVAEGDALDGIELT